MEKLETGKIELIMEVIKSGNSYYLRVPREIRKVLRLQRGDLLRVRIVSKMKGSEQE